MLDIMFEDQHQGLNRSAAQFHPDNLKYYLRLVIINKKTYSITYLNK